MGNSTERPTHSVVKSKQEGVNSVDWLPSGHLDL